MLYSSCNRILRSVVSIFGAKSPARPAGKKRRRFVPGFEALETRFLLSTVYWDAGGDGSLWDDAANWSTDQVPGPGDDVAIAAGTIQLSGAVQINSMSLSGGSLSGGSITANEMTWSGGTLASSTLVEETLTLSGGGMLVSGGATLTNAGEATWISGNLSSLGGSSFRNEGSLTVDGNFAFLDGYFESSGTLNILTALEVISGNGAITGSVTITGGYLGFYTSGEYFLDSTVTNNGTIAQQAGCVHIRGELTGSGSYSMGIAAEGLIFDGATATIGGSFHGNEVSLVNGATVTVLGGGSFDDFLVIDGGSTLTLGGAGWIITGEVTVAAGCTWTLGAGTYSATDHWTNEGTINWTPGAATSLGVFGSFSFSQSSTGVLNLELHDVGSFDQLGASTLELAGTLNVALLEGYSVGEGGVFTILTGSRTGTFDQVNLPSLPGGLAFQVVYESAAVKLVAASADENEPPVVANPGDQTDVVGYQVGLAISASDPDGDNLTYSAPDLPPGLTIDSASGYISGTITSDAVSGSPYTVTVTVFDGVASASQSFQWSITYLGLANPGAQNNLDGDPVLLALQARGTPGPLIFDAGELPDGLDIDPDTGEISGTIAATAHTSSPYTTTVTVSYGTHSASQTFSWYVGQPARPWLGSPGDQVNAAGDEVALPLSAIGFSAAGLTYSAPGLPDGLDIDPETGLISGTIADAAASDMPYQVTATVTDGINSASQTFFWTVNFVGLANPGTQFNDEDDTVSLELQAHGVSGPLIFDASGLPEGLDIDPDTGEISGTIANGATDGSPYTVTVTASDGTHEASQSFTWYVGEPPFLSLYPPGDQVNAAGDSIALQLLATEWDTLLLTYSAPGLPDGLEIDPETGLISGTIADSAASETPYEVTVTVTDHGTNTASQTFFWTVNFVGLEDPYTQFDDAGDEVSLELQAYSVSGLLIFDAEGLPEGLDIDPDTGVISGTIAVMADGGSPYTVTVTASDGTYSASQTFSWYVSPQPTLALDPPGNQVNAAGDEVALQLWAVAPSSAELTYLASGLPDGLSIDADTGLIFGTIIDGAASATPHEVTATVSDGTNSVSQTFQWVVTFIRFEDTDTQYNRDWDMVSLPITAHDASGRRLTFNASGLPAGLDIDPDTGVISGTIAAEASTSSPYTVTVTASDGMYSARQIFQWLVSFQSALSLDPPGHQVNAAGEEVALQLSAVSASSLPLIYWAEGLPGGLDVDPDMGLISGTVATDAVSDTPYLVTAFVSDGTNTVSQTFAWRVTSPGAPQLDVPGDILATARPVEFDESEVVEVADEIGNNYLGSLDVDLYRVQLAEGDWLAVTVQFPAGTPPNDPDFRIALRIFDSSGNELLIAGDDFGLYPEDEIAFESPADGTYYVGISYHGNTGYNPFLAGSGAAGLTGTYALTLSYFAAAAPGRPPGPATPSNYRERFWATVPGFRGYGNRVPQGVDAAHTIPQDWADVFQQKKGINIHEPQWIRGMTNRWHRTYDGAFQTWMDARMKQMGLNPGSGADKQRFRNTVNLDEVLKVRDTLLGMDEYKLRMITSGMNTTEMRAVLTKSGLGAGAATNRRSIQEAGEAQTASRNKLQEAFPRMKKFLTALGAFAIIGEGIALAGNIANHPPLVLAAYDDFAQHYQAILASRQMGQPVSNARWWDLLAALERYLNALEVPPALWAHIVKWKKENIGAPDPNLFWP